MRNTLASILLAATAAVSACADSAPPDAEYDALAQLLTSETMARANAYADSVLIVRGEVPAGLAREGNGVISGGRDGIAYHYYPAGSTVIAWWDGAVRSIGLWEVRGAGNPVAQVAGHVSMMNGDLAPYRITGDGDLLVFVDTPSSLVLAGAVHDVVEMTSTDRTYDVLVDVTFPSAGRATMALDGRYYEVDLTPPPPVFR